MSSINLESFHNVERTAPQQPHAAQSLWKAAYDHPAYVAAGVAAATIAVAAVVESKGFFPKLSPFVGKHVLLVEDGPFGEAIEATIREQKTFLPWLTGPNVTRVAGIKSLEPFTALSPQGSTIALNPSNFDVALVNGTALTDGVPGSDVAAVLSKHHVTTIGTSLSPEVNDAMVANGATFGVPKSAVLPGLMDGRLNLRSAVVEPEKVRTSISELVEQLKDHNNPLREQANERMMQYFQKGPRQF